MVPYLRNFSVSPNYALNKQLVVLRSVIIDGDIIVHIEIDKSGHSRLENKKIKEGDTSADMFVK